MIFTYNKQSKEVSLCEETDFKSHSILERQDLEKWIETYPDILGESLLIITTEYDQFDKTNERLDLLAIDREGKLVIVELKRDDSGKTVELQAIKYAAYCSTMTLKDVAEEYQKYSSKKDPSITEEEAKKKIIEFINNTDFEEIDDKPRIILVAKEFRPEVTASVMWLRKCEIDIRCIKLTPYNLNKGLLAFESNILIPLPEAEDYQIRVEKKENTENTMNLTQSEYVIFYKELINGLRSRISIDMPEAKPRAYCSISTGVRGIHYEWGFHGRPRSSFGVELHFERSDKKFNEMVIANLENIKSHIEMQIGEPVIFQKDWGKNWCRIYIEKNEGKITEELKIWAINNMEKFIKILQPEINKLNL